MVVLRIRPVAFEPGDMLLSLLGVVPPPPVLITSHVLSLSRLISLFNCAPLAASSPCLMSGLTGNGIGGLGGLGGGPLVFVLVVGVAPACWDACRGGGRRLDLRGGSGGTGVGPGRWDGEGTGAGTADLVPEPAFARFMNGFELVGEVDTRAVVSGFEPSSLERVDPLMVGLALFGAEVARLAKGLFEWKPGVGGGSLMAEETETRSFGQSSVWSVRIVSGVVEAGENAVLALNVT
jgi:hypothetical protein